MTTDSYKQALKTAVHERDSLLNERAKIDEKIARLGTMIESLRPLCDDEESEMETMKFQAALSEYGLADACRFILKNMDRFMTPISIRNALAAKGYDLGEQTNALASIHSICKRLVQSGEAIEQTVEGKAFYKWNTSAFTHSPLKYRGQRMSRVPTQEDAEAWAENKERRAQAQAEMEKSNKTKLPKVPEEPKGPWKPGKKD
jgi:hypothetical protein